MYSGITYLIADDKKCLFLHCHSFPPSANQYLLLLFCCYSQTSNSVIADSIPSTQTTATVVLGVTGAAAITAVLFHYDQDIYNEIHGWRENNDAIGKMSPVITNMGNGLFSIGLFGGFTGYGLIFKDNKALDAGKIGIESFLLTGISVQFRIVSPEIRNTSWLHAPAWSRIM